MIAGVALSLGCVFAYVVYVTFAFSVLRIYIDRVIEGTWLDKLLYPFMFLLLVSTFPFLFVIWVLDAIEDAVRGAVRSKSR